MPRPHPLALTLLLGCLDLQAPPTAVTPQLRDLRANAPSLDAVPRVPALSLQFDRAMAPPEPSSVMLFREPWSSALVADARDGVVTLGRLANRVPLRVVPDPARPSRWSLHVAEVLAPSIPLTLVFSERTRSAEGRPLLEDPDGGLRGAGVPMRVVDATAAGPVLTPAVVEAPVPADVAVLWLRADRPVRLLPGEGLALAGDDGSAVPTSPLPDERIADGTTRVLRVTPSRALRAGVTYGWRVAGVVSRGAIAAEEIPWRITVGPPSPGPVGLVDGVVCAVGEEPAGGACLERGDRGVTLRAATTAPAVARLVVSAPDGRSWRTAVTSLGTTHRARVTGLDPATELRWRLEAWDVSGRVRDAREGSLRTADAAPPVRIDEVLARPHSSSAQEFVELLNEGDAAVSLEGWVLDAGGARSTLPEGARIAGRGRAVVVGASFDPRGVERAGDPAVQPGAQVIVVRGSVAGRGLRDTGADLTLVSASGVVVSRFPGSATELLPQEGVSVVRADAELDEVDPAAWVRSPDGRSSPGGASAQRQ